jgi:hypothetical protein
VFALVLAVRHRLLVGLLDELLLSAGKPIVTII